ncbi:MAG: MFS transporter [Alphaproteobacteria bacterium]
MSFRLLVTLSCITLVLNTMAFMTIAPVLPVLFVEWSLTEIEAGLLGGAFFAGYVGAVPVLVALTDRILPKRVYIVSGIIGTLSCFGFALLADGMWSGFFFRVLTGISLAGTYMPALKALADSLEEPQRTRAVFYYSSVYAIGTALSILVGGLVADWLDWRWAFGVAGVGTLAGMLLGWAVLPDGKVSPRVRGPLGDFRQVFANRAAMVNITSYFGHLWEVFSNRVWIVTFLVFAESTQDGGFIVSTTVLATLVALIGVPASMASGEVAVRHGREVVIRAAMLVSCATGIAVALTTGGPLWLVGVLALAYGMTGYADTGTINAATVTVAEPEVRGATMAVHAAVGFAGGILGSLAVGAALQAAGGKDDAGAWTVAFLVMAAGSGFGFLVRWYAGRSARPPAS